MNYCLCDYDIWNNDGTINQEKTIANFDTKISISLLKSSLLLDKILDLLKNYETQKLGFEEYVKKLRNYDKTKKI